MATKKVSAKKVSAKKVSTRKVSAKKVSQKKVPSSAESKIKRSYKREANKIVADIMSEIQQHEVIKSNKSKSVETQRISISRPTISRMSFTRPAWSRISFTYPAWLKFFTTLAHNWLKFSFTRPEWSRISFTRPEWSRISFARPNRHADQGTESQSTKNSLPLIVVASIVALIVAGFWGPQIVRKIGIPIDPEPFTAIYFQNPTIAQTGIVSGDLVVFGVRNGFRNERNLTWRLESGTATLNRGQVLVNANSDSYVAVSTSGALPGGILRIYIEGTETPITIQVVG
jgi:hypothetical protein